MIKKTAALVFLFWASVLAVMSQTKETQQEAKISDKTSTMKLETVLPEFPKLNFTDIEMQSSFLPDFNQPFRLTKTTLSSNFASIKPMETSGKYFPVSGFAIQNPLPSDFNNAQINRLSGRFFIFSNGEKVSHAGLGEFTRLSSSLGWQPSKKLTIGAGGYVGRRFEFATLTQHNLLGAHIKTQYDITDKVQFNSWGQYDNSGDGNTLAGFNTLFQHSGIGSSVSLKIKNLSKIEGGVEYQYNESTKVWNLESLGRLKLHF